MTQPTKDKTYRDMFNDLTEEQFVVAIQEHIEGVKEKSWLEGYEAGQAMAGDNPKGKSWAEVKQQLKDKGREK